MLLNNKVYSKKLNWSNVGGSVWNQYPTYTSGNEVVTGNRINWTNNNGVANNFYINGNLPATYSNNFFGDPSIDENIWNETFSQCN